MASLFFISYFYDYSHHFSVYWCYFNTLTIVWYFSLSNFFSSLGRFPFSVVFNTLVFFVN